MFLRLIKEWFILIFCVGLFSCTSFTALEYNEKKNKFEYPTKKYKSEFVERKGKNEGHLMHYLFVFPSRNDTVYLKERGDLFLRELEKESYYKDCFRPFSILAKNDSMGQLVFPTFKRKYVDSTSNAYGEYNLKKGRISVWITQYVPPAFQPAQF